MRTAWHVEACGGASRTARGTASGGCDSVCLVERNTSIFFHNFYMYCMSCLGGCQCHAAVSESGRCAAGCHCYWQYAMYTLYYEHCCQWQRQCWTPLGGTAGAVCQSIVPRDATGTGRPVAVPDCHWRWLSGTQAASGDRHSAAVHIDELPTCGSSRSTRRCRQWWWWW